MRDVSDSPSALLERAAAWLVELSALTTPLPWGTGEELTGTLKVLGADAEWIAAVSPAAAQSLVEWLRYAGAQYEVAERRVRMHHARDVDNWVSGSDRAALAFARQVLGES